MRLKTLESEAAHEFAVAPEAWQELAAGGDHAAPAGAGQGRVSQRIDLPELGRRRPND
jgi:hypothetical protein